MSRSWIHFRYERSVYSRVIQHVDEINPLGQIIEIAHKIVFGKMPSWDEWLIVFLYVVATVIVGYFVFQRYEKRIPE